MNFRFGVRFSSMKFDNLFELSVEILLGSNVTQFADSGQKKVKREKKLLVAKKLCFVKCENKFTEKF